MIDKNDFCQLIEIRWANSPEFDLSLIDIILDVCKEHSIDPEMTKFLLNRSIIEKVENEALDMNMLKEKRKTHKLTAYI